MTKIIDLSGKGAAINGTENDANLSSLSGINSPIIALTHTIDVDDQNDTIEYLNASAIAVTLPAISTVSGSNIHTDDFKVTLKNIGAGVVTVTRGGTDTFDDGSTSITINQYECVTIQTDNSLIKWNIIGIYEAILISKVLTSPIINTSVSGTAFLDEDDLSSDSATKLASQQSIKAYIDTRVGGGRIDSTGSLTTGSSGISVVRNSTGTYTVTHNLGHTDYSVTANAEISSVAEYILKINTVQNNDFRMVTKVGATDTDVDWNFQIVSWG